MNQLYIGLNNEPALPPMRYLFIHDDLPDLAQSRIFDPTQHSFNPLKNMSYVKARELADALYTITPQGDNTLTVRNGRRALLEGFLNSTRLDRMQIPDMPGADEAQSMIDDILRSPLLRNIFCPRRRDNPGFSFNESSIILARLNRKEIGDFDALVLGLFLINRAKGQVVIPDFGFYGREAHISLVRDERLIAGVNYLEELPKKLRQAVLLIKDKIPNHTVFEDAETLAKYAGLSPHTNEYIDFVNAAMAS